MTDYAEIARGSRIEVFGQTSGILPLTIPGVGQYGFDELSVGKVHIQNLKVPAAPSAIPSLPSIEDVLTLATATPPSRALNSEQLVIVALVNQLGGAVTVYPEEMQAARKLGLFSQHLIGESQPDRFLITVGEQI